MSDPNTPPPPPPGYGPPGQGYPLQPGGAPSDFPGKTLGIVGLILSFFTALVGLVMSIVALRQSKKAGFKNTPAVVGIVIGIVSSIVAAIVIAVSIIGFAALASQCAQLGPGAHDVNGVTVTCS